MLRFNNRFVFYKLSVLCLVLSVFFLPIHLNLNNIFLVCFIVLNITHFVIANKKDRVTPFKKSKKVLLIVTIPFLLNVFGLLYTDELSKGIDYTIRAIPFLCLPLIAIYKPETFTVNYKKLGLALILGCLFVLVYSWTHSIYEIFKLNRPIKELFGPLYSHHNLVKALDLHAAYLSIFIYTAIGFIVLEYNGLKKCFKLIAIVCVFLLVLFMFHLLSRNAIIYFIISTFGFLIYYKRWKALMASVAFIVVMGTLAYNVKHNYLRDRLFNSLNMFEKKTQFSKKDDRFNRLAASYEVFLKSPLVGYGTAGESKYRREIFKKNRDNIAYKENYNAHNQFFEYLSTYGIIGGVAYLVFFGGLFHLVFKQKSGYFLYLVTGVFLACITESIFERSNGVVYMAVLIGLLLSFSCQKQRIND